MSLVVAGRLSGIMSEFSIVTKADRTANEIISTHRWDIDQRSFPRFGTG